MKSVGCLLLACLIYVGVLFLANILLYLLNLIRGTENVWIEKIFRELASPAAGGYAGMVFVNKIFKAYNKNIVFFGFSTLIIIFYTITATMMIILWGSGRFTIYDVVMTILSTPASIIPAYYAYKKEIAPSVSV